MKKTYQLLLLVLIILNIPQVYSHNKKNNDMLSMKNLNTTKIDIYSHTTYITQDFNCTLDDDGYVNLEFHNSELSDSSLQVFFDTGTEKIPANRISYAYESMDDDIIYRNWINQSVEIVGGGLNATVSGTLIAYEHKKAFVQSSNGRQYLVNFNDPQGFRILLKGNSETDSLPYKQVIKSKFDNLQNISGKLIVNHRTNLIASNIYYLMNPEYNEKINLDLRANIQNNSDIAFNNPDITIHLNLYKIRLSKNKIEQDSNDQQKTIDNDVNNHVQLTINSLKPKNIYNFLIKSYKNLEYDDYYILDMTKEDIQKHGGFYFTKHCLMLKDSLIMPTAELIIANIKNKNLKYEDTITKKLYYNTKISKAYIELESSQSVIIQHIRNNNLQLNKISHSLLDYKDLYWKTIIQNNKDIPANVLIMFANNTEITGISSGKIIDNNYIKVVAKPNTQKDIQYNKINMAVY